MLSGSTADALKLSSIPSVVDLEPIAASIGRWLPASLTVIVTTSLSTNAPSEAKKVTLYAPFCVKPGVQSNVPVPSKLSVKDAPVGSNDVEKLGVVASGSEALTVKVTGRPVSICRLPVSFPDPG